MKHFRHFILLVTFLLSALLGSSVQSVDSQQLPRQADATIAVGNNPTDIAVNPVTKLIYVVNSGEATLSIIDGDAIHDGTNGTQNTFNTEIARVPYDGYST